MAKPQDSGASVQFSEFGEDDDFLTQLSQGVDPSAGQDPLAELFLALRDEVEAPMPASPIIEGSDQEPHIISFDAASARRRTSPWLGGVIGAAAASLVLVGGGAVLHASQPGSALYGARTAVFGSTDTVFVELASTLEEMESKASQGDTAGTRALAEQARKQLDEAYKSEARKTSAPTRSTSTAATVTTTVTHSARPSATPTPSTTTVTVVGPTQYVEVPTTVVLTEYLEPINPLPPLDFLPTENPEPAPTQEASVSEPVALP